MLKVFLITAYLSVDPHAWKKPKKLWSVLRDLSVARLQIGPWIGSTPDICFPPILTSFFSCIAYSVWLSYNMCKSNLYRPARRILFSSLLFNVLSVGRRVGSAGPISNTISLYKKINFKSEINKGE